MPLALGETSEGPASGSDQGVDVALRTSKKKKMLVGLSLLIIVVG
jgi:hypothetical protein